MNIHRRVQYSSYRDYVVATSSSLAEIEARMNDENERKYWEGRNKGENTQYDITKMRR